MSTIRPCLKAMKVCNNMNGPRVTPNVNTTKQMAKYGSSLRELRDGAHQLIPNRNTAATAQAVTPLKTKAELIKSETEFCIVGIYRTNACGNPRVEMVASNIAEAIVDDAKPISSDEVNRVAITQNPAPEPAVTI